MSQQWVRNPDGSVSTTLMLTISVQIGPIVIAHKPQENPPFHFMPHLGPNWDWGWYSYCKVCGCNRLLVLYVEGRSNPSWLGFCNVCERIVGAPSTAVVGYVDVPVFIKREKLAEQKRYPEDVWPPPMAALKKV